MGIQVFTWIKLNYKRGVFSITKLAHHDLVPSNEPLCLENFPYNRLYRRTEPIIVIWSILFIEWKQCRFILRFFKSISTFTIMNSDRHQKRIQPNETSDSVTHWFDFPNPVWNWGPFAAVSLYSVVGLSRLVYIMNGIVKWFHMLVRL